MSLFVVGDTHGHRDELVAALTAAGLVDEHEAWAGGDARLWFLGDYVDRGPDGVGVIELVRRLADEAAEAGGAVRALLGNHEITLLAAYRFGEDPVPDPARPLSFVGEWMMWGGMQTDADRLTDDLVDWLAERPLVGLDDDHLLLHSDTTGYLEYGESVEEINKAAREVLTGDDKDAWWRCSRLLTRRHEFRGPAGPGVADDLMSTLGGVRIVHGHSTIPHMFEVEPASVTGPRSYSDGRALAVDGGVYLGGPVLVTALPYEDEPAT